MRKTQRGANERGLTLLEVVVAMGILVILAGALVGVLPQLSRTTQSARTDAALSQPVFGIFERIGSDWSNITAWTEERVSVTVDGEIVSLELEDYVIAQTDGECSVTVDEVEVGVRKRVTITCRAGNGLPSRSLRAEFGNPNV